MRKRTKNKSGQQKKQETSTKLSLILTQTAPWVYRKKYKVAKTLKGLYIKTQIQSL
jgi:hypothetical protein